MTQMRFMWEQEDEQSRLKEQMAKDWVIKAWLASGGGPQLTVAAIQREEDSGDQEEPEKF